MSQLSRLRARLLSVVGLLCLLSTCPETPGQVTGWINPGADNWFNAANWSFGVPGPSSFARIDEGGFALLFDPGGAAGFLSLGANSPSLLTVSGPGNLTLNAGRLTVLTGTLRIQNGGWIDVIEHPTLGNQTEIGSSSNGASTVTVTGGGSLLRSGNLRLGDIDAVQTSGLSGSLRVENGGWVDSDSTGYVWAGTGKTTSAVVTGLGSRWDIAGLLSVQGQGSASVTIADRGAVNAQVTQIGANGSITVSGSGSSLNLSSTSSSTVVGYFGSGALNVQSGGLATALSAVVGGPNNIGGPVSLGTATITGSGSRLSLSQNLFVGGDGGSNNGNGVLRVQNGGLVQAATLRVSNTGTVEVRGTRHRWRWSAAEFEQPRRPQHRCQQQRPDYSFRRWRCVDRDRPNRPQRRPLGVRHGTGRRINLEQLRRLASRQ